MYDPNGFLSDHRRTRVNHSTSVARADFGDSGKSDARTGAIAEAKTKSFRIKDEVRSEAVSNRVSISKKTKAKSLLTSGDHNFHPYAGTWRGAITCGAFQNVEHVIVIDNDEKTMTVSKVGTGSGGVNASAVPLPSALMDSP